MTKRAPVLRKSAAIQSCALAVGSLMLAASAYSGSRSSELSIVGPVEALDCKANILQVLGIRLDASVSGLGPLCKSKGVVGTDYIVVNATTDASGRHIVSRLSRLDAKSYVPGVSEVFVRGAVTSLKSAVGQFEIGGSRLVEHVGELPTVGSTVEVLGTQPQIGGKILANAIYLVREDETSPSTSSIIGSGASTDSIIGSGRSTNSIIGSGASTDSIIGSGRSTSSIIGSGRSTSSIIGSGASTDSIIGSGALHEQHHRLGCLHGQHHRVWSLHEQHHRLGCFDGEHHRLGPFHEQHHRLGCFDGEHHRLGPFHEQHYRLGCFDGEHHRVWSLHE